MSDMSDADSVEFLGSTSANGGAYSPAPRPPKSEKKRAKPKLKTDAGKAKPAKIKSSKGSKKASGASSTSTMISEKKATKLVKSKSSAKGKALSATATASSLGKEKKSVSTAASAKPPKKKKKSTTAPLSTSAAAAAHASASAAPSKPRPKGMLSVLDLCSNEDDAETEDETPRLQHYQQRPLSNSYDGPHYRAGGVSDDDDMSTVDDDSTSVVDSESGSIKTPPKKRVKKNKALAVKLNHRNADGGDALLDDDDEDDDGEGADEGWSDHNRWYCNICKDGGELLCCDRCPRAFHMSCLGMKGKAIPDTEWYCKMCTECLDRRRLKKESREKARLMREAAKLERDADKRKMKQLKEDMLAQKNADAIETKAKRVLEMQDRILSRKKIKYKDKEEEKLGKLAEDLAQTVRAAKEKLEKLEKEDAALKKKEEAFNKKKKAGAEDGAAENAAASTKADKPAPTPWVLTDFPTEHVGDLLAVWDSLYSFASVVSLTPFTLEQLAAALLHTERTSLMTEIHMCLLSLVLEDREEEDYVSDDEASMDEAERFRYEIQHAPTTIGVPTSNLLNSVSWPAILYNFTMAVPRYSASLSSVLRAALDAVNTREYPELSLPHKLALLKFLISRAYATEKFRQVLGKHVTDGVNATKEFNRAALQDRKTAVEEEKKLREKQRVELADLAEKGKASVKTWLKVEKKTVNGVIVDTSSVEGEDVEMKSDVGVASTSDSEWDDLTEEALAKNEEDLERLLADGFISRHEYLSRKKQLEHQREKQRKRAEEVLKKQKALELLERKRTAAKKAIQEGLVAKDPDSLKVAIEKAKECELPERIIVSASHVLEILEAEAVREEEAEARKNKFLKTMRELFVRTEPVGRDRAGLRYWIFRGDKSHLYVERPSTFDLKKHYSGMDGSEQVVPSSWSYYGSQAEVKALIGSLDDRNQYEGPLRQALKENFDRLADEMPMSKPGSLLADLHNDNDAKKRAKSRPANGNADDETADFLTWRNDKKTWKKKNHLKSDAEAFRDDLVDIEVWMARRLKELGSGWHDAGRNEWVKNVKTMASVADAVDLVLALENEVTSFQLRAQGLLAGNGQPERNGKPVATSTNGDASGSTGNGNSKDAEKSDDEDDDEDDDLDEEEAVPDDGTILWPTPKSRDRWVAEVKKATTFATLSAALGSFVQRLEIFGFAELAMDDTAVTTRRAKSEKEKQARKARAVKKKQKVEAEEADDGEVEPRHSVDDWEEDCYICTEGGELLCCDGCPRVFHYPCVGLRRVPRGKTFCHHCDPSVKPVYPVITGRTAVRAKADPEDAAESVESTAADSDSAESDAELSVDPGSLNAVVKHPEDQWDVECGVCRLGGELLCCDGCPRAFHTKCIDLENVPEDEWFCDECNLQTCGSCKKNKIRLDSHVICGSEDGTKGCEKVFHLKCAKLSAVPEDDWYCSKCRKSLK